MGEGGNDLGGLAADGKAARAKTCDSWGYRRQGVTWGQLPSRLSGFCRFDALQGHRPEQGGRPRSPVLMNQSHIMKTTMTLLLASGLCLFAGCNSGYDNNTTRGATGGAAAGAVIGGIIGHQ